MILSVFVCGSLIGVAVVVGHGQPPSLAVQQLHLLDCAMPCWMGITLGQTHINEGIPHLAQIFPQPISKLPNFRQDASDGYIFSTSISGSNGIQNSVQIELGFTDGITDTILVRRHYSPGTTINIMPSIGDVVNLYGLPKCVYLHSGIWQLYYDVSGNMMQVDLDLNTMGEQFVSWAQPILTLYFTTKHSVSDNCLGRPSWRGLNTRFYPPL